MNSRLDVHVAAYEGKNIYDFDNEISLTWYPKRIARVVNDPRSVLDLGLGHGFATELFSDGCKRHVVLEGSPAVIQNFRLRFPDNRSEVIETYFEEFDTDERFDLIVMGFVLEHVDDPLLILSRFRKFLAPAGKLFVAVPNAEVMNRRLGHLAGMLPDMEALSENDLVLGHQRYFTVRSLTQLVSDAGYKLETMEGIYLKPFATSQLLSLNLDTKVIRALCEMGVDYPELSCGLLAQLTPDGSARS
ncbi:class I SAM-dependent methyltransferase [Bradyrhizobium sp. BR13661]|jgi:SAM-dependent methyltransferase|uniref:class I SAM-dependent methyltransferase n=1 Tax=Bradyrhizobium sp. BR13661 TaxID=2940622 RepID=UPI002475E779|nr:class I SAM-dependent methyltransferase [Bradyrhizobium sp. BR13661]MDH6260843.1 SAM-dependent methyltransferase [Bradyrhizobium sp. BR13661]